MEWCWYEWNVASAFYLGEKDLQENSLNFCRQNTVSEETNGKGEI